MVTISWYRNMVATEESSSSLKVQLMSSSSGGMLYKKDDNNNNNKVHLLHHYVYYITCVATATGKGGITWALTGRVKERYSVVKQRWHVEGVMLLLLLCPWLIITILMSSQVNKALVVLHSRQLLASLLVQWQNSSIPLSCSLLGGINIMQLFCLLDLLVRSQDDSTSDKVCVLISQLMLFVATPSSRFCTHWLVVEWMKS